MRDNISLYTPHIGKSSSTSDCLLMHYILHAEHSRGFTKIVNRNRSRAEAKHLSVHNRTTILMDPELIVLCLPQPSLYS